MEALVWLVVIGTAIWVYFDANAIGVRKGLITGLGNMGPGGWAAATLLFWIIGFPLYLAKRGQLKQAVANSEPPPLPESSWPASRAEIPPPLPRTTGKSSPDEMLDRLERLVRLRDSGALTLEEFQRKKAELI